MKKNLKNHTFVVIIVVILNNCRFFLGLAGQILIIGLGTVCHVITKKILCGLLVFGGCCLFVSGLGARPKKPIAKPGKIVYTSI